MTSNPSSSQHKRALISSIDQSTNPFTFSFECPAWHCIQWGMENAYMKTDCSQEKQMDTMSWVERSLGVSPFGESCLFRRLLMQLFSINNSLYLSSSLSSSPSSSSPPSSTCQSCTYLTIHMPIIYLSLYIPIHLPFYVSIYLAGIHNYYEKTKATLLYLFLPS